MKYMMTLIGKTLECLRQGKYSEAEPHVEELLKVLKTYRRSC